MKHMLHFQNAFGSKKTHIFIMNEEKIPMETSSWNAVNQASGIAAAWLSVR